MILHGGLQEHQGLWKYELNAVREPEGNACEGASTAGTFVNPALRSAPLSDISRSFDF